MINTGVPGVEVSGGTLWTTLLRAPAAEYSGMVADESSSQHGHHSYDFAVMPYSGHWVQANVGRVAQELNSPVMTYNCQQELPNARAERSFISLEPANLVLSSIKAPQDGSDELVIRFYESAGQDCQCTLVIDESEKVWKSDLAETKGEELEVVSNCIKHTIMPFEIITLRVKLMS